MAPEYAFNGLFSTKSDIFSFGIIVLETISGQRSRIFRPQKDSLTLTGHVSIESAKSIFYLMIKHFNHENLLMLDIYIILRYGLNNIGSVGMEVDDGRQRS